ncbi:hypothetical protein PAXINDRAFT_13289 [Paxillus involutus ATCC 200175]|uniref:Uncharacterized protein n=1 Tax=Paxillus involutus ATCC 200175 TaxID=664439 RepID=A0A0C9TUP5_PAXIN|nr:hypothetical protein PAXINDRAFT_13289 [Paxillus involutus ATCC 200175]
MSTMLPFLQPHKPASTNSLSSLSSNHGDEQQFRESSSFSPSPEVHLRPLPMDNFSSQSFLGELTGSGRSTQWECDSSRSGLSSSLGSIHSRHSTSSLNLSASNHLHSNDNAYIQLEARIRDLTRYNNTLQQENFNLQRQNQELHAKYEEIQHRLFKLLENQATDRKPVFPDPTAHLRTAATVSNQSLLSTSLQSLQLTIDDPPLRSADFPALRTSWTKSEWHRQKAQLKGITDMSSGVSKQGRSSGAKGENVAMQYVQDENGLSVSGDRAKAIRDTAAAFYEELKTHNMAPATWGSASLVVKETFYQVMRSKYSELRYCDNNWKADTIAAAGYPSWHTTHVKKPGNKSSVKPKQEDTMVTMKDETEANRDRCDFSETTDSAPLPPLAPDTISMSSAKSPVLGGARMSRVPHSPLASPRPTKRIKVAAGSKDVVASPVASSDNVEALCDHTSTQDTMTAPAPVSGTLAEKTVQYGNTSMLSASPTLVPPSPQCTNYPKIITTDAFNGLFDSLDRPLSAPTTTKANTTSSNTVTSADGNNTTQQAHNQPRNPCDDITNLNNETIETMTTRPNKPAKPAKISGRNLCAREWRDTGNRREPKATFDVYYATLTAEKRKSFEDRASMLKATVLAGKP